MKLACFCLLIVAVARATAQSGYVADDAVIPSPSRDVFDGGDVVKQTSGANDMATHEFVNDEGHVFVDVNLLPYEYRCWMRRVSIDGECTTSEGGKRQAWYNDKCEKCRCRPRNYITCCTAVQKPIDYPSDCVPLLNKNRCRVVLRLKSNHTVACRHHPHTAIYRHRHGKRRPRQQDAGENDAN